MCTSDDLLDSIVTMNDGFLKDLSHVKHAVIAAEKIVPETMEQFEKVFGPFGFKKEAWTPMYGLGM